MRLRNLVIAASAIMAVGPLALVAAADATTPHGPIATVLVANNPADASYNLIGAGVSGAFTLDSVVDWTVSCSSGGSVGGVVRAGTTGIDPAAAFTLDVFTPVCSSFLAGSTASMDFVAGCDIDIVMNDSKVHDGNGITLRTDTGGTSGSDPNYVTGTAYMSSGGVPCVRYTTSTGCALWITGYITVQFHEADSGGNYQNLKFVGGGLEIAGAPYAPTGCMGLVNAYDDLTNVDITTKIRVNNATW